MDRNNPCYKRLIIGLGETGLSCARYFKKLQLPFTLMDSRTSPPKLALFRSEFPGASIRLGPFEASSFRGANELIVSPGVNLSDPTICKAMVENKLKALGDIELFAREAKAPIIAITGSNAKGTVVTLVGNMIKQAQQYGKVGGNIGKPALDLLGDPLPDFYVLEISSFQLETTYTLHAKVATILNVSPDHLDRHKTFQAYAKAKQRIYHRCGIAVWNRQDPDTYPKNTVKKHISFGMESPQTDTEFGLISTHNQIYLAKGNQLLIPADQLLIRGRHNWVNALAALAVGDAIHLPLTAMLNTLLQFRGLPHRCEWIKKAAGVTWYNDSKATNVGATRAALNSLGSITPGKIILIAGGLAKGADFSFLQDPVKRYVKLLILIGHDAHILKKSLGEMTLINSASDMEQAVTLASKAASSGDIVLLSPACASMDMFKNYEERGNIFIKLVKALH